MSHWRGVRALGLALVVVALSACQSGALQFRNDHRLSFSSPHARERVAATVTVRWTMRGFQPSGLDGSREPGRGVFAVFVDRAPMPVGKDVRWLFRGDASCRAERGCPSMEQLRGRGVLLTTDPDVTIDVLPRVGQGVGDEQHFVNVVLLDGTGHRIGESAWYLPFTSKRRSTS